MRGPSKPPAPVSGVSMPSCSGAPWPRTIAGAMPASASRAGGSAGKCATRIARGAGAAWIVPPCRSRARCRLGATIHPPRKMRLMSGSAASAAARAVAMVASVDQNVRAMRDGQGLARVLLDHGDGHPVAVDGDDVLEQPLGRDGRQARRGLVEQQHLGLDHQRHRHGQDLPLAARQRACGDAAALLRARESARTRARSCGGSRPGRRTRPSRGSRAPSCVGKMFCSCGT